MLFLYLYLCGAHVGVIHSVTAACRDGVIDQIWLDLLRMSGAP